MASKALNNCVVRTLATRGYAQLAPALKDTKIISGSLPNKITFHALDTASPLTRITVAFKAGARYESCTELGVSHVLRSSAGLSTNKNSSFIIARNLAQCGATVSASGDREFVYYTLETTKDRVQCALQFLCNIISGQEFRPWEISDNVPRLKYELAALSPQVRAADLLHRAAFRRSLGNSLFVSPKRVGKISSETLQHYAASCLTADRCTVTVVGDHKDTAQVVASCLDLPSGNASAEPATYYGGELRKEMGGELAHVALALPGCAAGTNESIALAIAAKALGSGPVTKWGTDNSVVAKAVGNVGPFAAAGFNVSYSDGGLFGIMVSVPKDEASKVVKTVGKVLKSGCLPAAAIAGGRAQLKLQLLSEAEEGGSLAEGLAAQALSGAAPRTPYELAAAVDAVNDEAVNTVFGQVCRNKLSMGAAGNLAFVPYVDELQ